MHEHAKEFYGITKLNEFIYIVCSSVHIIPYFFVSYLLHMVNSYETHTTKQRSSIYE